MLTRTGLYIIDSQLLKGHVYNGISGAQFQELPMLKQVFDTLDLNTQAPQTLVLDQHEDNHSKLSFINYSDQLSAIEKLATDLQTELGLKYTPTSILYFNPKHDKDVTISNYAQSSSVKVLVGPDQLDEFLTNLYSMDVFNIMSMNYKILWIKLNHLTKEATIKILNFDGTFYYKRCS